MGREVAWNWTGEAERIFGLPGMTAEQVAVGKVKALSAEHFWRAYLSLKVTHGYQACEDLLDAISDSPMGDPMITSGWEIIWGLQEPLVRFSGLDDLRTTTVQGMNDAVEGNRPDPERFASDLRALRIEFNILTTEIAEHRAAAGLPVISERSFQALLNQDQDH